MSLNWFYSEKCLLVQTSYIKIKYPTIHGKVQGRSALVWPWWFFLKLTFWEAHPWWHCRCVSNEQRPSSSKRSTFKTQTQILRVICEIGDWCNSTSQSKLLPSTQNSRTHTMKQLAIQYLEISSGLGNWVTKYWHSLGGRKCNKHSLRQGSQTQITRGPN